VTRSREGAAEEKLRVLYIHTSKARTLGAGPWLHAKIMKYLDRASHEIHAACASGTPASPAPLMQILRQLPDLQTHIVDFGPEHLGAALRGSWRDRFRSSAEMRAALESVISLTRLVREQKFSIIHTDERPRDAVAAILLARLSGAKSIIHMHVAYGEWMSPLFKWALKRADALFAVSDFVRRSLEESGHDSSRIHVLLNAIERSSWVPGVGRDAARAEFATPGDAPVLITVCRLQPGKGIGDLVKVLPALKREFPDVRLWVVGEEQALLSPGYPQELLALAAALGVSENLVLTGRRSDVPRLMAGADVYAMPSDHEPFGLVYLEAMAMQLPVVALANGGVPEFVEHGVTGLLTQPSDSAGLADALLLLLRDRNARIAMGAEGRRRVEEAFDVSRLAADAAAHYRQILSAEG
jgi:glycosyltransferase involved in cell wall biosynthesis